VVQPIPPGALSTLEGFADVDMFPLVDRRPTRAELMSGASRVDYLLCLGENVVDHEVIQSASRLRMIGVMEIFPLSIDIETASARSIPVAGLPHSPEITETTAEWTFLLLGALSWRLGENQRLLRDGSWVQYQSQALPADRLRGRTLGLVGLGAIGKAVARRARVFDMDVIYSDPVRLDDWEEHDLGVGWRPLEVLFSEADVVTLCLTLTRETDGLVGESLISRMKPDSILVNTARGRVLDEEALADALERGAIRGAALDVHRLEWPDHHPQPNPRLMSMPNVILTPHIGTSARQTREWMATEVVENIRRHHQGLRPHNVLNPEVFGESPLQTERIG
jgi:glyoxylate reductase